MESLIFLAALCGFGILFKVLEKLVTLKDNPVNKGLTFKNYILENDLRTLLSIVGSIVAFLVCHSTGQLNEIAAFSCGYLGESAARAITQKFKV